MSSVFPPALSRLIRNLERLPGVGEKTATRFALNIMRWPKAQTLEFVRAIAELQDKIKTCSVCFTFSEQDPCPICADSKRDASMVCVVEEPGDVLALEKAGAFRGRYHVLHGVLSPMEGIGPDQLKIGELLRRVQKDDIKEVILATSSTVAGEATSAFLAENLKKYGVKIARIACGIPMGMDLKYADQMTLQRALKARTNY
jgi:recombination protein RecR